jgi:hypothetical protein
MAFFNRFILALLGLAVAVLLTAGVVVWLIFYVVFASLRWLATGQKPQVLLMWQQLQAMRKRMSTGYTYHGAASERDPNAVVIEDAVVREVHEVDPVHKRTLPKD